MTIHDIQSKEERQWTLLQEVYLCHIVSGQVRWDWRLEFGQERLYVVRCGLIRTG